MAGINCGILHNARPLTAEQVEELERRAFESNETFVYLDENSKLCFTGSCDPNVIKDLAWHNTYELSTKESTFTKKVYAKRGIKTYSQTGVLTKQAANDSWVQKFSEGLEFTSNGDGTCRVSGIGICTDTDVILPERSPDGELVTAIDNSAFQDNPDIESLLIPDSVTCIGYSAIRHCSKLIRIMIGNGVTSIGDYAFYWCENLKNITIGSGLTSLGQRVFESCYNLTSIIIDTNNQNYKSIDGNLYSKDGTKLIQYAIGQKASSFTIPSSVTNIGDDAFLYCNSLTGITIPDSVTSIGDSAFNSCESLTGIIIPNSVTSISDKAFFNCSSLTSINIPASVTSIGNAAFQYCTRLTSITIPDSVTSIGDSAFKYCNSLTSITFEGTVSSWGSVVLGAQWNVNSSRVTYVQCTDGVVSI